MSDNDRAELDWIAVDWGTSHMRAWGLSFAGEVVQRASSARGMATLTPDQFEAALLELVGDWLDDKRVIDVVACGMVGARQGWLEAPYAQVPCEPLVADRLARPSVSDTRIRVSIIPGLCQQAPADVMRGEETQIAGFLREFPDHDGVICLPGTHCKWAEVSAGRVTDFQTFMTGELFALLLNQSVLRHGLQDGDNPSLDGQAFLGAVGEGLAAPEQLVGSLFSLRAQALLQGLSPASGRARLSGLLIGHELAAVRPRWQGRQVSIIGDSGLADLYTRALHGQGVSAVAVSAERVTLAGLTAAHAQLAGR